MPLYKLTSLDVRDTALVDCATGETLYRTSTPVASSPRSRASSITSWASSSRSQEKLPLRDQCTTAVLDREGQTVAEIVWEGTHTPEIRIGDEVLKGTGELFDAAFVRVLPDETYLPTRMEYTWRITPETLTLLDDDAAVVGRLYADCAFSKGRPVPALRPHTGLDYLELHKIMSEDLLEVIVSYLLVTTLRERLFSVTKYVYGGQRKPLSTLRSHAMRSFVSLRDSIRHSISHSKHHH